jgi:hypothetical protein
MHEEEPTRQFGGVEAAAVTGIAAGGLGLLGGAAMLVLGMAAGVVGSGLAGVGFLLAIAALPAFVTGLVLRSTISAIRAVGREQPRPDGAARTVSTLLSVLAAAGWASPAAAALLLGSTGTGDQTAGFFVVQGMVVGAVATVAMWTLRYRARQELGALLIVVTLAGLVVPGWETLLQVSEWRRQATYAEEQEQFQARYANFARDADIGEIATTIGDIGSWRLVDGGQYPALNHEAGGVWSDSSSSVSGYLEVYGAERLRWIGEFGGRTVRFLLVGQCWVVGEVGEFHMSILTRGPTADSYGPTADLSLPACDGTVATAVSRPIRLVAWTAEDFTAFLADGLIPVWWLNMMLGCDVFPCSQAAAENDMRTAQPYAERWLLFLSEDPGTPESEVREAFAALVPTLVLH